MDPADEKEDMNLPDLVSAPLNTPPLTPRHERTTATKQPKRNRRLNHRITKHSSTKTILTTDWLHASI